MFLFYAMAFIPVVIGAALWVAKRKIVWWEWAISATLAFSTAGIMHFAAIKGMTADVETWSGHVTKAVFIPEWVEEYEESHTRTVGSGKNQTIQTYYTTEHRTHRKEWNVEIYFGAKTETREINESFYEEIKRNWGGSSCVKVVRGYRPGFDSGDRNDYVLTNKTNYVYPACMEVYFENRVQAAPTTFSYPEVPKTVNVFEYPKILSWEMSQRLLGIAGGPISILEWDRMNAELGPMMKVNVILIGFGAVDSSIAKFQEAKWIGGKKNDLVLCYGGEHTNPTWSYVFGWTEEEIVKRNLETILLKGPIDESIIPKIKNEIFSNYKIKDWEKFNYISIEPPIWSYFVMIGILIITQGGFFAWGIYNCYTKDGDKNKRFGHQFYR